MEKNTAHLTCLPEGAVLEAWHTTLDLAAVRLPNGKEQLVIDGQAYDLPADWHHPTQQVINICHLSRKAGLARCAEIKKALSHD